MGESGGNQKAQEAVAERLNKTWAGQGVKVVSLHRYYSENGQFDYLFGQGYSKSEIDYHAGIRDTSEVLALDPTGVRLKRRNILKGMDAGLSGASSKASASIGRKMLQLKIDVAAQQIRDVRKALNKNTGKADKMADASPAK